MEKSKELYREYFRNQLDLIFNIKTQEKQVVNRPRKLQENQVYDKKRNIHDVASIGEFKNGHAIVEIVETHDINNILNPEIVEQLVDAMIMGKKLPPIPNRRYNFIDKNYVLTFNHSEGPEKDSKYWFKSVRDFHHGVAAITDAQGFKRYLREDGTFIVFNTCKGELYDFFGNCGLILENDCFYFVDANDKIQGNGWVDEYDSITNYQRNKFSQHLNLIDTDQKGNVIRTFINMNRSFVTVIRKEYKPRRKVISRDIIKLLNSPMNLRDYIVDDKRGSYELRNIRDRYVVKYPPIMVFDKRFTLCMYKNQLYLYDRFINKYTIIGNPLNTFYDDHLIVNYRGNKAVRAFLIYNCRIIDITEYYREKLTDIEDFKITRGIELLNEEEYCERNKDKIREIIENESKRSNKELFADNERLVEELERNVSLDYGIGDYESLYFPIISNEGKGKR